jgi:peroxiredoxin
MARTESTQRLRLGATAPDFSLPDAQGKTWSMAQIAAGKPLLVVFACNHCPYVIHLRNALGALATEFLGRGVNFVAINSNDSQSHPDDSPEHMPAFAQSAGWSFPYLVDATQQVAHAWHAACTPDFFLIDAAGKLAYAGQFDSSRPKSETPITGSDLRAALEAVISGCPAPTPQIPSLGCNIKWIPGNEPKS